MRTLGLAFGPTGGHLIPACLVAQCWIDQTRGDVLLFSSADPGHPILQQYQLPYNQVNFRPWTGTPVKRVLNFVSLISSYGHLRSQLTEMDVVLGLGGYSSVPVMGIAREQGIPTFIQEQNRIVGRANKLFMPGTFHTFFGFPPGDSHQFRGKYSITGNPVRRQQPIADSWFKNSSLLVVFGGSQGAADLSRYLEQSGKRLLSRGWHIYYVRGNHGHSLTRHFSGYRGQFREVELNPDLPSILAQANCVWGRAGAGTISELIAYDIPALLFPYPYAADAHQHENARWAQQHGPARVMDSTNPSIDDMIQYTRMFATGNATYDVPWDSTIPSEQRIVREIRNWFQ